MDLRNLIRDFVFGMEDGLVSNLGLVLGMYVGGGGTFAIILAGLASMFAGAFSMSAGSYLSAKSQREVYEQETRVARENLRQNPKQCLQEMKSMLRKEGLVEADIKALLQRSSKYKHPKFVCDYLVQKKVGISREKFDLPLQNAFTMFFSFLIGSSFPVLPFLLFSNQTAPSIAVTLTITVLFIVGWAKTMYTQRHWLKSGIEIVLVGVGAGILGYIVGWILSLGG